MREKFCFFFRQIYASKVVNCLGLLMCYFFFGIMFFFWRAKVKRVVPGQKFAFFNDASLDNGHVTKRLNLEHTTQFEYVVVHFSRSSSAEKVINN